VSICSGRKTLTARALASNANLRERRQPRQASGDFFLVHHFAGGPATGLSNANHAFQLYRRPQDGSIPPPMDTALYMYAIPAIEWGLRADGLRQFFDGTAQPLSRTCRRRWMSANMHPSTSATMYSL